MLRIAEVIGTNPEVRWDEAVRTIAESEPGPDADENE
jgi:hypothetical protein